MEGSECVRRMNLEYCQIEIKVIFDERLKWKEINERGRTMNGIEVMTVVKYCLQYGFKDISGIDLKQHQF